MRLRRITLVGVLIGTSLCCSLPEAPQKPENLLLITIDTARADRFSYSGSPGPGTPRIDALARDGAGFSNAISPVPLTLPAHASLFTGRQPPSHTIRDNGAYRLPDAEVTLAEVLNEAGFDTAAFIGAQVLDARYGLGQGFDAYDDAVGESGDTPFLYYAERSGERVVESALSWLNRQTDDTPLFVWVHLFDPHTPYRPPEPERSRHASPYDGEIAYADRVVGKLVDGWQQARGLDRTAIVVTSDHGESLGEHDEKTHGVLVHDATLRVPLVIRSPGLRVEGTLNDPVHLIDVMPTVLSLFELEVPEAVQGRNLVPLLQGETIDWSSASGYAESLYARLHHGATPLIALRESGWKLIRGPDEELYDLDVDPGEQIDLAAEERQRRESMALTLDELVRDLEGDEPERVALDDESRRALDALGYVSAATVDSLAQRDPRDALRSLQRMAAADRTLVAGDLEGAVAEYQAVIASESASVDARVRLAQILITHGRPEPAEPLLVDALVVAPHEPALHYKLGYLLEKSGRFEESLRAYDAGLTLHPAERSLRDGRWRTLNQLGRLDEMLSEAEEAVAADPSDGMARFARAVARSGRQGMASYIAALERELAELPGDRYLEAALAQARTSR